MVNVHEKLNLVRFRVDKKSHIHIDKQKCLSCQERPCLFVCPAGLFTFADEIMHSYEGCLECGACYLVCEQKALVWDYPDGGLGVSYRQM